VGHALTVTETALAFLQDARRRGDVCRPLDWMTEVHHPIGNGEAVIPDALLYYQRGPVGSDGAPMLRAFRGSRPRHDGPGTARRQADRLRPPPLLCAHGPGRRATSRTLAWRSGGGATRLLFVLGGTGPAGIENRISALRAAARDLVPFLHQVPVLAAPLTVLFQHGPAEPVWRPVQNPDSKVSWYQIWQER